MSEITLEQTDLWYYNGTSDKVYNVCIKTNPITQTFKVTAEYGRRNSNLQCIIKYEGGNRGAARNKYQSLINTKVNKGYDVQDVHKGNDQEKIEAYKAMVFDLTANGIIAYPQRMQLEALLDSGDTESINTAIQIIDVKREKSAA